MLEVLRSPGSKAADQLHVVDAGFPTSTDQCGSGGDEFMLDGENLLDYIDFTCCDVPSFFDADGDILPDLETELLAEFEDHERGGGKPPDDVASSSQGDHHHHKEDEERLLLQVEEEEGQTAQTKKSGSGDEVSLASAVTSTDTSKSSSASAEKKKKKKRSKNSNGKRKVDWTPDLHRRFVQAVEQLGIDKAVPSRILEIMGIEGLTRHNIASHLQKYRSHRKHLMAQEAEAASWAKKRQIYAAARGAPRLTKDMPPAAAAPWVVRTTIRLPSPPFGRPLHVWGHPSTAVEATAAPMLPVWPRHLAPVDRAYWHQPPYNGARTWGPMTQGTPCVPPPIMPRFPTPPVPGTMMPHPMYRPPMPPPPQITASNVATLQLRLDAHPSKESIDAAIGDVLAKPWLPLPLGLKPPSLDSVMSELHKQGIPKIPPSSYL